MPQGSSSYLIMIVSIVLIGIMMWWQSRKAKQQQQKMKDFRSSLEPGTEVITIGGIIGTVCAVKDGSVVIETGADRVRVEMTKWAIGTKGAQTADGTERAAAKKDASEKKK